MIPHARPGSQEGAEEEGRPFPDLRYDRVCRTERSEAYLLSEGESPLGRVDLHFGGGVVHALLVVERDLDEADVQRLVQRIDDDLVWTADVAREDFLVTAYRGTEIGVISDRAVDDEVLEDD
ncbi:MAG TPA: hypothetical protein VFG86_14910 [Chloroflexota bacterium]|jgi:hypothetical protein|nr:hypothetical protein [Chloroflexota bacterium]